MFRRSDLQYFAGVICSQKNRTSERNPAFLLEAIFTSLYLIID